ncbi:hypothetical protein F5Y17DRAFT_47216 [Xylariaceae sp. FL0594]|nr:hypothetical protein F5Y17DRAFT_47216 [Xylariaceae sp. FL0594]
MQDKTERQKESRAYLAAKERYQAVLDDAGRGDFYCRTNRVGTTRLPSSGDCNPINRVDHPERRRSSGATSNSSSGSGSNHRSGNADANKTDSIGNPMSFREKLRSWMNRPAY